MTPQDLKAEREALKPCPFCGSAAVALANEYNNEEGGWFVHCAKCGGSTGLRYSCGEDARPLVIEQWNRRTESAELERVRKDAEWMRKALTFYAEGAHFNLSDEAAWDTVSGEPPNWWCDEAGTATIEDGTVAAMALTSQEEFDKLVAEVDAEDAAMSPSPGGER